jgi:hypothetical protein
MIIRVEIFETGTTARSWIVSCTCGAYISSTKFEANPHVMAELHEKWGHEGKNCEIVVDDRRHNKTQSLDNIYTDVKDNDDESNYIYCEVCGVDYHIDEPCERH